MNEIFMKVLQHLRYKQIVEKIIKIIEARRIRKRLKRRIANSRKPNLP